MRPFVRLVTPRPSLPLLLLRQARPWSSTGQWRLKEDKSQSPHEIESAKQEQLKTGQKQEELESASETAVRADRDGKKDVEQLQKETAKKSQDEHPAGKS